ncbi:large subunit ribosomal protein L4e [Nematocida parisii]|uniref:Large ribosomal subunit protein uL4 n=1 Tax=Nematocida parisii (strain ERTm3) TaxID=935791 RepID=I3EIP1_NEMP3|nr:60s ribosomal protein l4 [Nematocida parisii ERTm1]EIJ89088.1 60s ribosomal protein l4 [Nematocida parisii ERTm3]KAI5125927.1 large subunit ribosomal protein L4e [Nematocida parisii]EIJ93358.1 60s ribosomal protein l4 [Nematocida parisii ERTm1]KAI5126192.1 large subunit ribosomal protein L4e [Nematocida parisii]KAI5140437.1 large subunit ribosomal protein L4e [Nematocida parisii]|eukprot:XP_013059528.1 60s ribosomal protein l4 [Nematocida parisii ERTm1]
MIQNQVECYEIDGNTIYKKVDLPKVFSIPVRSDLVCVVHDMVKRNTRQPYAVDPMAGMRHSAHSWGTGRALARVPRVSGGGTQRAGQGAFANFCRKGRMASPTTVLRRWFRKTTKNTRRHAAAMAVAATASPALVESRGHIISQLKSIPIVISNEIESLKRTKQALELINNFSLTEEIERVKNSKAIRAGKGKARNRRWVLRRGVLVIYKEDKGITKAFRNIRGIDLMPVDQLDLLKLAPGGHLGRLVVWTEGAFERLRELFGDDGRVAVKEGYNLPESKISCPDVKVLLKSQEVQALFDKKPCLKLGKTKADPSVVASINPYFELFNTV